MPKSSFVISVLRTALLLAAVGAGALTGRAAEQLRGEASAFLQAHVSSPVNWLPWGEAAFAQAKHDQKAVFVAVGSFTSELSRAMRQQTFSNADTARLLNENFVCILVDRDEHPEVASLYQAYLSEVKQVTGQPLNLWLTPDLLPYEGGAYLPPTEEWGKTSFPKLAQQARDAWKSDAAGCKGRAAEAMATLKGEAIPPALSPVANLSGQLSAAAEHWRATYDAARGGFGDAPKNPEPELLRFLLKQSSADRAAALATLHAIATSALRDPLDGGFFRYSTDAGWHVPYLQKNLADQARLALAYFDAAAGDDRKVMEAAARGALDFALTKLVRPNGTFAAAEDGTADEFLGYYTWTEAEIDAALGADSAAFKKLHGVETAGNVSADDDISGHLKGRNLLRSVATIEAKDTAAAARLLAVRAARPAPPRDERATAGAQGLLLAALARAGEQSDGARYLDAAGRLFIAVNKELVLSAQGEVRRFAGSALPAGPTDYAALALGCREFARVAHRKEAEVLATHLLAFSAGRFFDPARGRYFATATALPAGIFVRPLLTGEVPSAETLAILAGAPSDQTRAMASASGAVFEDPNAQPPGDLLLGLAGAR